MVNPHLIEEPIFFGPKTNSSYLSLACAMLLKHYRPDAVGSEEDYLDEVTSHGDAMEVPNHLEALNSFGLQCEFSQSCEDRWLRSVVQHTGPVACGFLSRRPFKTPEPQWRSHWCLVWAYIPGTNCFRVHDPFSKLNFIRGENFAPRIGNSLLYSAPYLVSRWCNKSCQSGWAIYPTGINHQ